MYKISILMKKYYVLSCIIMMLFTFSHSVEAQSDIEEVLFKTYSGGGGKCYGRSMISYQFDTIEEKVILRPAYSYLREVPPVYRTETERILVEPAHTRIEVTPPKFEYTQQRIKVKEAESYVKTREPLNENDLFMKDVSVIELAPAYQRWEKTKRKKNCRSKKPEDCLEWQLVDIPAKKVAVDTKVRSSNASINTVAAPTVSAAAEYVTVSKKVLKTPASYKEVKVPAQYRTVSKKIVVEARRFERVQVPTEYKVFKRIITIREGGVMEAREVVCRSDYPRYLLNVQRKLKELGYYEGTLDGSLGKKTKQAIMDFQKDQNFALGQLDYNTLKKLGLIK